MTTTDTLPPEVALRLQRREAASHWRIDHLNRWDRERLWRAFRVGALREIARQRPADQAAIRAALSDAERAVPFGASP